MPSDRFQPVAAQPSLRLPAASSFRLAGAKRVELLESRTLLSVAVNSSGFTQVTPSANSQMIYVSSSTGSDANSGLSPDAPVATIARAYSLLRNDEPDWLLFMRGDTFDGSFSYFNDSGLSSQEPMVLTYYGDSSLPLPVIDAGANTAFRTGAAVQDLYIIGLNFTSSTHDPSSPDFTGQGGYGFYDLGGTSDLMIEDCTFSYFINDLTFQGYYGPLSDITIYGDQILDSYSVAGHSEGMYADTTTNLTIENNDFDHDGWNESVAGAGPTIYNHDCYLHSSDVNCVVTGNTFADAASFGLEARAGGIVDNNLFVNDPYGFAFGLVNGSTTKAGGVTGQAVGNVVIQPRQDGNGWGIGALIGNLAPGGDTVIANNIFSSAPGDTAPAMEFAPGNAVSNPQQEAGLHSVLVDNNTVYDWGFGIYISPQYSATATGADSISDVTISNNYFQDLLTNRIVSHANAYDSSVETWSGNVYSNPSFDPSQWFTIGGVRTSFADWQATVEPTAISQVAAFADPTRTIDSYVTSLGLSGGLPAFMAEARDVNQDNWNPVYMASAVISYIQGGFVISGSSADTKAVNPTVNPPAPTATTATLAAPMLGPVQPLANQTTTTTTDTTLSPSNPASAPTTTSTSSGQASASGGSTTGSASSASSPLVGPAPAQSSPTQTSNASPAAPSAPADVPPALSRMVLNYANPRHTAVSSITLVFSKPVTSSAAMVSLASTAAGSAAGNADISTFVTNPSGDGKTWQVTWFGQPNNDLQAGQYTLTINASAVTDIAGVSPAADIVNPFDIAAPQKKSASRQVAKEMKIARVGKTAHVSAAMKLADRQKTPAGV